MEIVNKVLILILLNTMYIWGQGKECNHKDLLLNILKSNATWIVENNNSFPFDTIHIEDGLIKIKKDNSDFHTVIFSINVDDVGEVGIFLHKGLPFGIIDAKEYDNKTFLLIANEHNCTAEKLLFKMKEYNTFSKQKKRYMFKKIKDTK